MLVLQFISSSCTSKSSGGFTVDDFTVMFLSLFGDSAAYLRIKLTLVFGDSYASSFFFLLLSLSLKFGMH